MWQQKIGCAYPEKPQQTALPPNSNFWLAARAPEGPSLSYLRMLTQAQTHVASGNTTEPLCTSGLSFPFWLCALLTALHTGLPESQISILHLKKKNIKNTNIFSRQLYIFVAKELS